MLLSIRKWQEAIVCDSVLTFMGYHNSLFITTARMETHERMELWFLKGRSSHLVESSANRALKLLKPLSPAHFI